MSVLLPIRPDEIIVDNFAGGGGASLAIRTATGREVDVAINHDPAAIAMHGANHPNTLHLCQSVWKANPYDVAAGRPVGLAWFSPDCKHHSKAKGGKPLDKRSRDLAWVVVMWARTVRPRIIMLENVEEFRAWGPLLENGRPCPDQKGNIFDDWAYEIARYGYHLRWGELRACDYGAPTIRKRLFLVARCDGEPIHWPKKTHGPGLLPFRTAAECIDWSLPCPSIFLTKEEGRALGVKRPLAEATMRRIARGVKRYVLDADKPFIVTCNHGGDEFRGQGVEEPFKTITASRDAHGLVGASLVGVGGRAGQSRPRSVGEPTATVTTKADTSLVAPFFVPRYGERAGQRPRTRSARDPLATVVPDGNGASLVAAHLSRQFGNNVGQKVDDPMGSVMPGGGGKTSVVAAHITKFNQNGDGQAAGEPMQTVMAGAHRFGVVATFMAQHNGGMTGHAMEKPVSTLTQRGTQQALVAAALSQQYSSNTNGGEGDPREPFRTVMAGGQHQAMVAAFLAKYYGSGGQWQDPRDPLHTVPTKGRFGAVTVKIDGETFAIADIGMRMLMPRELFRAQGFPDTYIIDPIGPRGKPLTKTEQVRNCGNSVSRHPAVALLKANIAPSIDVEKAEAA